MIIIVFVVYTALFAALASLPLWVGEELRPRTRRLIAPRSDANILAAPASCPDVCWR
jgi:hypothetical protein